MAELTELLVRARTGDRAASERLFRAVYDDLHRLAARQVARGDSAGMSSTSLVHEAYLRLARPESLAVSDREHFFAIAARAMRQIAVSHARERLAQKRGGGTPETTLSAAEQQPATTGGHEQMIALDAALSALDQAEPRLARLVELRFFGGLDLDEAGRLLGFSPTTLKRDFRKARAFLHAHLGGEDAFDDAGRR
jgi:RNA polymerase sigma factor (TIGR02999 family)